MKKQMFSVFMLLCFLSAGLWAGAQQEDTTTIHVVTQKHPAVDALKVFLPEFEEETGIQVDLEDIPQDQLNDKVKLALASGSSEFDIVMLGHMLVPQYQKPGWLASLTDFIEDPEYTDAETFQKDDILGGFFNAAAVGDQLFAMPFYGESTMLMYNKEMFAEAGLNGPPETMEELREYAEILTDTDNGQYGIAMRGRRGINWYPWSGFCYGFGGSWLDENGKPAFNSPEAVAATELFAELIRDYGPPGAGNFSWNDVQLSMQQGTTAMIIDATNFGPRLEDPEESKVVGNVGYAMVPAGKAGRFPSIYSAVLAIPEFSEEKAAAWEFLKWATSSDIQVRSALEENRLDLTRISAWNDPRFLEKYRYPEMIDVTVSSMDIAIAEYLPRVPEFGEAADVLGVAINEVITGKDAQKTMDNAVKSLQDAFE